jgi:site-specific DNA-methyltransferase (adenine-specific)
MDRNNKNNKNNKNKDVILYGDVFSCLDFIEDKSIDVVITSPPYYKQRDYGFDGQIGQEKTPEEYIGKLLKIFLKIKDKLKDEGIFFLNIGDKYLSRYGKSHLLQIPYRLAYHMQKAGWYLEDILIWYKPNHMPSSVKDRFSNTYEPILVFSKRKGKNIYINNLPKILKVKLQQIKWKHTAAYPEKLVETLLKYIDVKNISTVLDPFAGTGTTAVVVNRIRNNLLFNELNINIILIEKFKDYIEIIKERTGINKIIKINDKNFKFESIKEEDFPNDIIPKVINNKKYGEIYIAKDSLEFLSILK